MSCLAPPDTVNLIGQCHSLTVVRLYIILRWRREERRKLFTSSLSLIIMSVKLSVVGVGGTS